MPLHPRQPHWQGAFNSQELLPGKLLPDRYANHVCLIESRKSDTLEVRLGSVVGGLEG